MSALTRRQTVCYRRAFGIIPADGDRFMACRLEALDRFLDSRAGPYRLTNRERAGSGVKEPVRACTSRPNPAQIAFILRWRREHRRAA